MDSNDGNVEESIFDLETKFTTSTTTTQQKLLTNVTAIASAVANHEEYVGRIVEVLFSTLIFFGDKKNKQHIDSIVFVFSKHSAAFAKSVISRIQKIVQRFSKLGTPFANPHDQRTIYNLFSWNTLVIEGITSSASIALFQEQIDNNITFFQAVITQQTWLSSAISLVAASRHLKLISFLKHLRQAFSNNPDILQLYTQHFSQVSEFNLEHATMLGAVFSIAHSIVSRPTKKAPKVDITSLKTKFVEWYMKSVLNSTTKASVAIHELFVPLLAQVNVDEFKSILLPCISRVIKRNPEVVLETVAFCLSHLSIDLGSFGVEIAQVLQIPLLSTNDVIKKDAKLALRALLGRIADTETLSKIQQSFVKALKDKPPSWQERVSLCSALEVFCVSSQQKLVESCIAAVADQIDSENNDEGRSNELQVLGRCMNKALEFKELQNDKAFNSIIKNLQSDKDGVRLSALEAAVESVRRRVATKSYEVDLQKLQKFRGIVQHLVKVIKGAKTDAVSALLLLEILSYDSTLSGELLKPQSLLITSFANDSFLFKPTFITKLSTRDQDLKDLASLLVSVLSNPKLSIILAKSDLSNLFTTLTSLTVGNIAVRKYAAEEIQTSPAFGPFYSQLVSSFFKYLGQITTANLEKTSSHVLREAIAPLVRPITKDLLTNNEHNNNNDSQGSVVILAKLLLILHHPFVQGTENKNVIFSLMNTQKVNGQGILSESFPKLIEHILTYLHPENGLYADSCVNVFRTIVRLQNVKDLLSSAVQIISSSLCKDMQELNGLSSTEIGVFRTPVGELFVKELKIASASGSNVQVSREKHRRGERGLYSVEDQKWEQQMRQELELKKKKENEAAEAQAKEEQLKKEAAIREGVVQKVTKFHNTTQVVKGMCEANSNTFHRFLPQLCEVAWDLLGVSKNGHSLGLDSIHQLLQHLSLCVRPMQLAQFDELRLRIAWCLVHIHHYYYFLHQYTTTVTDKTNLKQKEIHKDETDFVVSAVQDTVASLHRAAKLHGWSATNETFSFYFHILEFCIVNAHLTACFITNTPIPAVLPANPVTVASERLDQVIELIEDHIKPAPSFPTSPKLISLLIYLVSQYAKYKQRASTALVQLLPQLVLATEKATYTTEEIGSLESLLKGLFDNNTEVRLACISSLAQIPAFTRASANADSTIPPNENLAVSIWFASFDSNTEVSTTAKQLWQLYDQSSLKLQIPSLPEAFVDSLRHHLADNDPQIQKITATAITEGLRIHSKKLQETVDTLFAVYNQNHPSASEKKANLIEAPEKVKTRIGVALCLGSLANHPNFDAPMITKVFDFLVSTSLFDINDDARQAMVQCGLDIINAKGSSESLAVLALLEKYLSTPSGNTYEHDRVQESLVIFLGSVAKHLPQDGNNGGKTVDILNRLVQTLKTPSESVQRAVCTCLIPLMTIPIIQAQSEELVNKMLDMLQTSNVFAERRGAAFGLAGMVKGLGITSLKKHNIINVLQNAIEDKKHSNARQGALFAFECLSVILQTLFVPFAVQILPKLLVCFGDNSADVRDATVDTARAIMSQMSGHGVKLVLPALLKSLEDKSNWKSKKGSIELLGTMAFCAPKQLSACLPMIVPRLSAVLTDSHEQVQEAAREALAHIGSVIRNPEIQNHVPLLLQAMDDPDQYTRDCLEALIHTNFVHTIDAASLSLIIPILHRGMKERSTETKKKAAQIIGNMYSLTEFKDLEPYVDMLVEDLKVVLSDPIPEVRATTAKALGSLIKGMTQHGSSNGPDDVSNTVVPYLLATMKSEAGSVERSGAAQGLSEILAGLPTQKFEELLQEIQQNASNPKPHVREGYIGLFVFLPSTMTQTFQNYLKAVLPIVLAGLSDESEAVREVSLRAGQAIVNQYAQTALPLLLPTLEEGLFDDNWRIRQSSVQLLGDLLYRVISKSATGTEEDTGAILTQALGMERRNRVLSALYMIRSDVSSVVRQKALLVWKSVVTNTPKTLKEILPSMMRALIDCLGSENLDKRQVAGKTLGDLVEKLGDKILPEIIPILENGLESPEAHTRQGVCIGLSEVMSTTAKAQLVMYADVLIPAVRRALVDPLPEVREAAGQAFDTLYKNIGSKAIDEIVPNLLIQLQSAETPELMNSSLDAIREIMSVRSNVVLPLLLPKLLSPPVTVSNIRALASVADVAGGAINYHLSDLIPPLVNALAGTHSETLDSELATDIRNSAETIVLAVQTEGIHLLFSELVKQFESEDPLVRTEAINLLGAFCAKTKIQFESEANFLLESLLLRFNDKERQVQQAAWQALGNLTEAIRKENLPTYIPFVRGVLAKLRPTPNAQVLGFGLPKGLAPILPMFLNGLMLGSPTIREEAAYGLGDLISLTPEDVLKPFLIQITGPLIRIIGDRFPHTVKAAILQTLNLLISKGGPLLRPFVPQLQTTFVKALNDTNRIVRVHAATALGLLMTLTTKVDPLVNELLNGISSTDDGIQESMLSALQQVLLKLTNQLAPETLDKVIDSLQQLLSDDQEVVRTLTAKVVGAYVRAVTAQTPDSPRVDSLLRDILLSEKNLPGTWQLRHGFCAGLGAVLKHAPKQVLPKYDQTIVSQLLKYAADEKVPVRQVAAETIGKLLSKTDQLKSGELSQMLSALGLLIGDNSSDVKLSALKEAKRFAKVFPAVAVQHLGTLVPPIMVALKDRTNIPVKLASERALVHLLQIHTNPSILQQFAQTQDTNSAKNLLDYTTRVLSKLAPKSESEDEHSD